MVYSVKETQANYLWHTYVLGIKPAQTYHYLIVTGLPK